MSLSHKKQKGRGAGLLRGEQEKSQFALRLYNITNSPQKQVDTITRAGYLIGDLANWHKFHGRKQEADYYYAIEDQALKQAAILEQEGGQ